MIMVTRFNKSVLYVNAELIEFIEETPDTVITLTTGKKLLVMEGAQELVERVVEYRRKFISGKPFVVNRSEDEMKEWN